MEESLKNVIKDTDVQNMVEPVILMNAEALEKLKKIVKSKVLISELGKRPKYCGLPILIEQKLNKDEFLVFDFHEYEKLVGYKKINLTSEQL